MRLNRDSTDANMIRAYSEDSITVNDRVMRQSVVVTPEQIITDWPPQRFQDLAEGHFEVLLRLMPEIVVLGTGRRQRFPHPQWLRPLLEHGIGVEVMDTSAACRTYNIVTAEGRYVAAALLIGSTE